MSRVNRVLTILRRLQGGRPVSGRELARELAVDPRTIYRDVQCLRDHGIPLESVDGGGYRLDSAWWLAWK